MASLYVIREKTTNSFCTSQRGAYFSTDLNRASMFASSKNAEKAIRGMFSKTVNKHGGNSWSTVDIDGNVHNYHHNFLQEYISLIEKLDEHQQFTDHIKYLKENITEKFCDMEVVEVKLTLV